MVALPASPSARLFPFNLSCPGQYIRRRFRRWMSKIGTCQSGLPISLFTFCSKITESVKMMACVTCRSPVEAIHQRAWVTVSTSIVKLVVETILAALSSVMVVAPCLTVKPHPYWYFATELSCTQVNRLGRSQVFRTPNGK